jgi:hypothetical protein
LSEGALVSVRKMEPQRTQRSQRKRRKAICAICVICVPLFFNCGRAQDCNLNGIADADDIEAGVSEDCNADGVPDACEVLPLVFAEIDEPVGYSGSPQVMVSDDFDGDGFSDLALGAWQDDEGMESRLSTFFNRGDGTFAPGIAFESAHLWALESADIDADGDLDLVTANGDRLRIYRNDQGGDRGDFSTPLEVATSPETRSLKVADVDLDGRLDLVTLNRVARGVTWYRNLGDGPLEPGPPGQQFSGEERTFELFGPIGSLTEVFLAVADFNGDGDPDLALTSSRSRSVSVFENTEGGRSFPMAHTLPTDGGFAALVTADLNGDGLEDIAGATKRSSVVVWRRLADGERAEGEGGDRGFENTFTFAILRFESLAFADVDGDGILDLLVGGHSVGPRLDVLRGDGDGTFRVPEVIATVGNIPQVDDFDGDGDADLAVVARLVAGSREARSSLIEEIRILHQGERGRVTFESRAFPIGALAHFMDLGHLNGDGVLDVVTANSAPNFALLFGRDDGSLEEHTLHWLAFRLWGVVTADLDGDGDGADDLVFFSREDGLLVLENDGRGEFGEPVQIPTVGTNTQYLSKADVDGDGRVDILAPDWGGEQLALHFGDGRGGLSEPLVLEVGRFPHAAVAGDLDGDGDADLVTSNIVSGDLSLLFQLEPRRFAPAVSVPVSGVPQNVALADFDQDGDLDVVTVNASGRDVAILLNPGDGRLGAPVYRFDVNGDPFFVTVADLNGDGITDLVTTDGGRAGGTAQDGIHVLLGSGDGTFLFPQNFRTGTNPRVTRSADLDADGDLDLVVAHRNGASIVVLLNETVRAAGPRQFLSGVCTPLDFERVSVSDASPLAERRTQYLLPAREDAELLETHYINVARFPLVRDFLREVFPERFGDLSELGFAELALRRSSRDYFVGALRRIRLDDAEGDEAAGDGDGSPGSVSTAYGFDVRIDPSEPGELLTLEETRAVRARLEESFDLKPLVYLPSTPEAREAARRWEAPDFPVIVSDEPIPDDERPPVLEGNPTFQLEIPADTLLCGVFAEAGGGRGPREEYELKTFVRLREGTVMLPTESDTFTGELFEEVLFGPQRLVAEPQETGSFRLVRIPPNELNREITTYRFTYRQPFSIPPTRETPARLLELEVVSPLVFRARGDEPVLESQGLPEDFFSVLKGREPLQAKLDGEPLLRYGSCTYESLSGWVVAAELEDGTVLDLEERFEEAASLTDTGPASLVRAEVALAAAGEARVVTDYFQLVYSSLRHNRQVDYWVILDPPAVVDDLGAVHAVELRAPESSPDLRREGSAAYLGVDFQLLRTLGVTSFTRTARAEAQFLRGDVGGDGQLDVADAILVLRYLFEREATPSCLKAADSNDDGRLNIADPIAVVSLLFGRGVPPPEPFPTCGIDPTEDGLICRSAPPCP